MKKYGLSSDERIKRKKDFEEIYSIGKIIISEDQKVKSIYIGKNEPGNTVKIAAVVSKKSGNAYWRNRVKRLIKESYRLNKIELLAASKEKKKSVKIIFSAHSINEKKNKKIGLPDIMPAVKELMKKIKTEL